VKPKIVAMARCRRRSVGIGGKIGKHAHGFLQILHRPPDLRGSVVDRHSRRRPDLNAVAAHQRIPDVVPPTVVVKATYPGANPKVIAETVSAPLEEQINGVEDMMYMKSVAGSDARCK